MDIDLIDSAWLWCYIDILHQALNDSSLAWDMDFNGRYVRRRPIDGDRERNYHQILIERAVEKGLSRCR